MKKTDLTNLRTKEIGELTKILKDKKLELSKRAPKVSRKLLRRDIAQISTLIREKEIVSKEAKKK